MMWKWAKYVGVVLLFAGCSGTSCLFGIGPGCPDDSMPQPSPTPDVNPCAVAPSCARLADHSDVFLCELKPGTGVAATWYVNGTGQGDHAVLIAKVGDVVSACVPGCSGCTAPIVLH